MRQRKGIRLFELGLIRNEQMFHFLGIFLEFFASFFGLSMYR